MPHEKIAEFSVSYLQVLDEQGNIDESLHPDLSEDKAKEMYHIMVLLRTLDEKLFALQRSGKIGTYAQTRGQEAAQIGSGFALEERDWVVPSFREMGVFLARGADKQKLVQAWNGDTRAFANPEHDHNLPISIPIASQTLHATGIAWASQIQKKDEVTIVYFGDGATSQGDFNEALNFAGVFKLPVVFFCQNNQWAISTPREKQTAAQTIAQRAIGFGVEGIQIDGNDMLAVYKATTEAVAKARRGEGPTLIEAITFRMGDHTTSDDSAKYRKEELLKEWEAKDPLKRVEEYFKKKGTWTEEYGTWVKETVQKEVEDAVERGLHIGSDPDPTQFFDELYATIPKLLEEQKQELLNEIGGKEQ